MALAKRKKFYLGEIVIIIDPYFFTYRIRTVESNSSLFTPNLSDWVIGGGKFSAVGHGDKFPESYLSKVVGIDLHSIVLHHLLLHNDGCRADISQRTISKPDLLYHWIVLPTTVKGLSHEIETEKI